MYPQYQQQQAPFPIDSVFSNPVQYQPGILPFQLNVPCAPQLQPYLPLIGTAAIDAIQAKYGANQLRVFLYNQMSTNGYQNNDFLAIVKSIAQYVDMMMSTTNVYQNVQQAIFDGAEKITEMYCAANLDTYPILRQMVDPVLQQRSQPIQQVIQQYAQQLANFNQSRQVQQGYQQPSGFPQIPGGYNAPQTGFNQPQSSFNQPQRNWGTSASNNTGIFNNNGPVMNNNSNANSMPATTFLTKQPEPAPPVTPMRQPVTQWDNKPTSQFTHVKNINEGSPSPPLAYPSGMQQTQQGVLVKASEAKWVPSEKYPYNIGYDSTRFELYYLIEADGVMKPITKPLTQEQLMDRSKHFKSSICPGSLIMTSEAKSQARIDNLTEALRTGDGMHSREKDRKRALSLVENTPENKETIDMLSNGNTFKSTVSDAEVWIEADNDLLSKKRKDGKIGGYSTCAYVNDVLVSLHDPKILADRLLEAKNFNDVVTSIKDIKACYEVGDTTFGDEHEVNYFNNRLTKRLNRFITKQLALEITVESFIEDGAKIVDYIEKKFGEKFSNPLRAAQRTIIHDCCSYATDETESDLMQSFAPVSSDENTEAKENRIDTFVTFFYCPDFFVNVNAYSCDLKIDIPKGNGSVAVFPDQLPLLAYLANHIFQAESDIDMKFNRKLVRTLDRVVLEINQSVIDPETFLVSLA
jgi:hypothetical protein